MYVRFVVGADSENAHRLDGLIQAAFDLHDDGQLYPHEVACLREALVWFGKYLPIPPFLEKQQGGEWTKDVVCWFRPEASEAIQRMWDVVSILREHGVPVRFVTTEKPGWIVYEDHYQIVAERPKRTHR
jgi:hypothetical protein